MSKENPLLANERLREERLRRGWSQQKLADELGIAVVTVNRWERGKQQPTGYYRLKLSTLFEKRAEELGLVEEQTEATSSVASKEPQGNESETMPAFLIEQADELKDTIPSFYDTVDPVAERSSLECETAQRPISSSLSVRSNTPLLNRRKRTIRLFVTLALLITVSLITFSIVRLNTTKTPVVSMRSIQIASPLPLPTQNPGKLALNDPLTTPNGPGQWSTGDICKFANNALHMTSTGPNYCSAAVQEFDNMTFQIDISLQKGIWAGISFRADADSSLYYFSISVNGQYEVDRLKHHGSPERLILLSDSSPAIHIGYNQVNTLKVEANKSDLTFWINGSELDQAHDTSFTNGYVGICAGSYDESTFSTLVEATFRNAKVWQL